MPARENKKFCHHTLLQTLCHAGREQGLIFVEEPVQGNLPLGSLDRLNSDGTPGPLRDTTEISPNPRGARELEGMDRARARDQELLGRPRGGQEAAAFFSLSSALSGSFASSCRQLGRRHGLAKERQSSKLEEFEHPSGRILMRLYRPGIWWNLPGLLGEEGPFPERFQNRGPPARSPIFGVQGTDAS